MKAIEVHDLKKNYKIAKKEAGIVGSLKHLVSPRYEELPAVKGISFQIAQGESVGLSGSQWGRKIYNHQNAYRNYASQWRNHKSYGEGSFF